MADAQAHHRAGEIHYPPTDLLILLGNSLLDQGRNAEAIEWFDQCGSGLGDGTAYARVAAFCRLGNLRGAVAALHDAARTYGAEERLFGPDPDAPGTFTLGTIEATALLERSKERAPEKAVQDLLRASRIATRSANVAHRLAELYEKLEQPTKALVWYRKAAALGHGDLAKKSALEAESIRVREAMKAKTAQAARP